VEDEEVGEEDGPGWAKRREKGEGLQLMLTNFSHPPNRVQTKKF
jgi:hypothetical protein